MYQFLYPTTIVQAEGFLRDKSNLRILAGGTDLIIALKNRDTACEYLMDIKKIPELGQIGMTAQGLEIGAAATINRMIESGLLTGWYNALLQSGKELANVLLRNRATLAGNICNASPGGDMLTPCLVLGARLETISPGGSRQIALKDFFTGVKKHVLAPNELVLRTIIPKAGGVSAYRKKKRIRGHDLAQVGVAGSYGADGGLKLAFGAVAPTPLLLDLGVVEPGRLREKKAEIIQKAVESTSPISDVRSSKEHRLAMIRYLTGEVIDELLTNMETGV